MIMKHRKIKAVECPDNKFTVHCALGNFHITSEKVKNKNVFHLHAYSKHPYAQALIRRYDADLNREEITYKSLNEVLIAIEKSCNLMIHDYKSVYYEEQK